MSVRSGQSVTVVFTTRNFGTGAAANADSLPAGTLYVNGAADAAAVTVTNLATGVYRSAVTLPALAAGDVADLLISATVGGVADNAVVWSDTKDLAVDSTGGVSLADGAITEAKIATPAEAAGRPTGVLGMLRRVFEWAANRRTRDRATGDVTLYGADDATEIETQTQSTASDVDTQTRGA